MHEFQHFGDTLLPLGFVHPEHAQAETDVVRHVEVGKQRVGLEYGVDPPGVGGFVRDFAAADVDVARVRLLEPGHDA